MKFVPTLEEVNQLAQEEKFHIVPISCEILSDLCTPCLLYTSDAADE